MSNKFGNKIKEYKKKKYNLMNGNNINDSPILFPSKLTKKVKIAISHHTSELSTLNTMSNSPIKLMHSDNQVNILDDKTKIDNVDIICENLNKPFFALEQLIIDDNNNEKNLKNNNSSSSFSSNKDSYEEKSKIDFNKTNIKKKLNNQIKSINVPKLNFTDIYDYYKRKPLFIKVINNDQDINDINGENCVF
jgi:hypothetical protein